MLLILLLVAVAVGQGVQSLGQRGTSLAVAWGTNSTLEPLVADASDSLMFAWKGNNSVAYIVGNEAAIQCDGGTVVNAIILGWESPVVFNLSTVPDTADTLVFVSASPGLCPTESISVKINRQPPSSVATTTTTTGLEPAPSAPTTESSSLTDTTPTTTQSTVPSVTEFTTTTTSETTTTTTQTTSEVVATVTETTIETPTQTETTTTTPTETAEPTPAPEPVPETVEEQRGLYAVVIGLLLLTQFVSYVIKKLQIVYLSDSVATIFVGAVASGIYHLVSNKKMVSFDPSLFFYVLLPCIIFESGYTFHKRSFFSNFGSIFMYAIVGCLVSSFVTGFIMFGASRIPFISQGKPWSLFESLVFGSLISSTDPVATLAIFSSVKADQTLYGLVFGESVMNDAVAILLYRVLRSFEESSFASHQLPRVIGMFSVVFFGSMTFGIVVSMVFSLVLKYACIRKYPSMEIMLLLLVGYSCYIVADLVRLSGIVSIFFYGCACRHYTWYNLSKASTDGSLLLFRVLADASETFVFLCLGLSIFPLAQGYRPGYIIFAILAVLVGRAANIFPISLVVNFFRRTKVPMRMQTMLWHAGLRGAVSYALAIDTDQDGSRGIKSTTQVVVLFTVIVLGGSTAPILRSLHLTKDDPLNQQSTSNNEGYQRVSTNEPSEEDIRSVSGDNFVVFPRSRTGSDGEIDPPVVPARRRPWGKQVRPKPTKRSVAANMLRNFDNRFIVPLITRKNRPPSPTQLHRDDHSFRSIFVPAQGEGHDEEEESSEGEDVDMDTLEDTRPNQRRRLEMDDDDDDGLLQETSSTF